MGNAILGQQLGPLAGAAVFLVSLICAHNHSLISLAVSLVLSLPSLGTETDPSVDSQQTNEQTNRTTPQFLVTDQVENGSGHLTV